MSLRDFLEASFEQHAQRTAFSVDGGELSYGELGVRCWARAQQWKDLGLVPGDRVAAYLPNGPEYLEVYLACALAGFVLVPLNLRLHARELSAILLDASPRLLVWLGPGVEPEAWVPELKQGCSIEHVVTVRSGESLPEWTGALCPIPPDAPAQIYFTSGTTGRPKGVVLQHRHVLSHARAAMGEFGLVPEDVWGHFAPMFHLADAWACFAMTGAGAAHAFLSRFEAPSCFEVISSQGVTMTNLVPTMLQRMVATGAQAEQRLGSLRLVLSGGAPIAPELVRRVQGLFGCEYVQTYGLTETSPFLTVSLLDEDLRALDEEQRFFYASRTGRPFGGIQLRVIGPDGSPVPADGKSVGEIQARGEWVFEGYWNQPEASAAAFDGEWFLTGDLATLEARGFLNIVDRKKDIILSGGETVYSTEVENALYTHQLVRSAAAFPMHDAQWGEVVAVAIVRGPSAKNRTLLGPELIAHCRLFLADYKVPRLVYFVDEFPMTGSGKVQKRLLRERCLDLVGERLTP